jgi:tRNA (guanine37-N1)-methyltransferase
VRHTAAVGYDCLSVEEVLRQILPEGVPVPSSFEQVGHLAHLNLKAAHEPYKHIIGQVMLDKLPSLRTVVNKVGTIDTEFREFHMEVLAGPPDFDVEVKEHGCTFRFDYSKVYWNSRLQTEHARLCDSFALTDAVYDVMAGIGPFAIPAAAKGVRRVWANDLNAHAVAALRANAALNKVAIECFHLDGREFIRHAIRTALRPPGPRDGPSGEGDHHFVLNLPALAVAFLDAFALLDELPDGPRPILHVYCFSKAPDPLADALAQVERSIGRAVPPGDVLHIHDVRNVAPAKEMLCVSFRYPPPLPFPPTPEAEAPAAKRPRIDPL